ncbi:MAG: glutamine--fructose-6-phosphate transaminase (isomerizing) [Ruminococcaceae bacterium]|nr:glutamine--fructose-6-phosphate transaminase (isomerizing) [Oscillospiraceae bacterium]
MCGIVGYIGEGNAKKYLLQGLEKLEYRGYDSAGISVLQDDKIVTVKKKGPLKNLKNAIKNVDLTSDVGIGHTRWATHGIPSDKNSHPHLSEDKKISVVHNGIIENYAVLKEDLIKKGYKFVSETDTEVIAHLISHLYSGSLLDAVISATKQLKGSYSIGVISQDEPDKIIAVRKDSPLIVGLKDDGNFIASDIPAILSETKDIYILNDNEFALLKKDKVTLYDERKNEIERKIYKAEFDDVTIQKDGYDHFMIKEIFEQPKAIKDTLLSCIMGEKVEMDSIKYDNLKDINKIFIVGCGSAYHAGLVGKIVIEKWAKIPVNVDIASEFIYRNPLIDKNTLLILISQSGETADTISALKLGKKTGCKTLAITNAMGSTISREADFVFYTRAGIEISVASTKAYITQLIALYAFALLLAQKKMEKDEFENIKAEILLLDKKVSKILLDDKNIKTIAKKIANEKDIFYIGRGVSYASAMEGALKLKEISYIHSEAYAGGELKHGPIALIENGTVVIAINTDKNLKEKMDNNIKEVASRGAYVIGIVPESFKNSNYNDTIKIPDTKPELYPVLSSVPLQLLSYYVATEKGYDVDKPRNLAKSVTVE